MSPSSAAACSSVRPCFINFFGVGWGWGLGLGLGLGVGGLGSRAVGRCAVARERIKADSSKGLLVRECPQPKCAPPWRCWGVRRRRRGRPCNRAWWARPGVAAVGRRLGAGWAGESQSWMLPQPKQTRAKPGRASKQAAHFDDGLGQRHSLHEGHGGQVDAVRDLVDDRIICRGWGGGGVLVSLITSWMQADSLRMQ
jgi:hypothetical protein